MLKRVSLPPRRLSNVDLVTLSTIVRQAVKRAGATLSRYRRIETDLRRAPQAPAARRRTTAPSPRAATGASRNFRSRLSPLPGAFAQKAARAERGGVHGERRLPACGGAASGRVGDAQPLAESGPPTRANTLARPTIYMSIQPRLLSAGATPQAGGAQQAEERAFDDRAPARACVIPSCRRSAASPRRP